MLTVKVSKEPVPCKTGFVPKSLVILGGNTAVNDAVAEPLAPELVPVSVVEIKPLTLVCGPAVVALTLTLAVQDPPAGIFAPTVCPNASDVAPAAGAQVGDPVHVVLADGVAATSRPAGKLSVNLAPVNWTAFGLLKVNDRVETPSTAIGLSENALLKVGWLGVLQPVNKTLSILISEPLLVLPELKA